MFELKWTLNGRSIRGDDLAGEITKAIEAEAKRELQRRADRVRFKRCPEHRSTPTLAVTRDDVSIKACCEQFQELLRRELSR